MKQLQGTIVSVHPNSTVHVEVTRQWQHPLYLKRVRRTKKYACHCEKISVEVGDTVVLQPTRPLSKTKRFIVVGKVGE